MICRNCGQENDNDSVYCASCGQKIDIGSEDETISASEGFEQNAYPQPDVPYLVPNQQYGDNQYVDPNQQYGNNQYVDPNQQYGNNQQYDPNQQYGDNQYVDPNQQYGDNQYVDPNQQYGNNQQYDPPAQPSQKKNGGKIAIIVVLVILLIGALGAVGYFVVYPKVQEAIDAKTTSSASSDTDSDSADSDDNKETVKETESETKSETKSETESATEGVTESVTTEKSSINPAYLVDGVTPPDYEVTPAYYMTTPTAGLFVRSEPNKTAATVLEKTLPQGTKVKWVGSSETVGGWYYVYVPEKDVYGWVSADFLVAEGDWATWKSNQSTTKAASGGTTMVTPDSYYTNSFYAYTTSSNGLFVRYGPGQNYAKSQSRGLPYYTEVIVKGYKSGISNWVYVYIPSRNAHGWVCSDFLER